MLETLDLKFFFAASIVLTLLNLIWLRYLSAKGVIILNRRWLLAAGTLPLLMIVIHLISRRAATTLLGWLFHIRFEHNFSATVSSLLLLSAGILAFAAAFATRLHPVRAGVGLVWAVMYLFLSYDELYMFHESFRGWRLYFGVAGAILVLAAVYAGWFADRANRSSYMLLMFGLAVTAGGGLLLDDAAASAFLLEEFLELTGTIYVLVAAYTYLRRQPDPRWRTVRRLLASGGTVWVLVMIFVTFWPLPMLEAQAASNTVSAEYLNGDLSLLGYSVDNRSYYPGEWIPVTLYWRANQPLSEDYAHSVKLLRPETGEVIHQSHAPLGPPTQPGTRVWPQHFIFKTTIQLKTQDSLPVPASYGLAVNVWRDSHDDSVLPISQTNGNLLQPETLMFAWVDFLSSDDITIVREPLLSP